MKISVLGAGLVGSAIIKDLSKDGEFHVTAADINKEALSTFRENEYVTTINADLKSEKAVKSAVAGANIVVNAVPGFMGFQTLKYIIEEGKNVVDIAFFPEDAFQLDELAKVQGVTAITDCGVAPGLCNIIAGHKYTQMERMDSYLCYVGGLPITRRWPFEYKAVFSPSDVIEEYTRPARYIKDGKDVIMPALSEPELIDLPGVSTLESFNTDGLRSLIKTLNVPNMKEKTLRYPGHIELMRVFRHTGLFSIEEIEVGRKTIRPLDVTSKLLFDKWKLQEGEEDFTVMQVVMEGIEDGQAVRHEYNLLDYFDTKGGITSMARTTGYTCTAAVRMLAEGHFNRKGICPPEYIGMEDGCLDFILDDLEKRGVVVE